MHVLIPQHLPDLAITERGFPLAHFPRDLRARTRLLEELLRRDRRRDGVVRRVEDLEAQARLRHTQVADLAQVARVDVGPGVALAGRGRADVLVVESVVGRAAQGEKEGSGHTMGKSLSYSCGSMTFPITSA